MRSLTKVILEATSCDKMYQCVKAKAIRAILLGAYNYTIYMAYLHVESPFGGYMHSVHLDQFYAPFSVAPANGTLTYVATSGRNRTFVFPFMP